ncbi:DUF2141 domain-containing protein [Hyphomonas sp.]|uniref:DUF2141 domain-containing protein n=1 Tax=Hyphomonas sp. TaxID=87 RepID=UPI00391A9655
MTRPRLATALLGAFLTSGIASAGTLTVTVEGVRAHPGPLYVGVQTESQYMKDDGIAGEMIAAPAEGTLTLSFDLPEGRYAISAWHDLKANGNFDLMPDGRPADGWSTLKAETLTAAPTFEQASVTVGADGKAITLKMIYPE